MGNYNAGGDPKYINLSKNGSMNYQSSEVDVLLNFRTPIDYKGDGWMEFPGGGAAPVGAFTGLYQVTYVTHRFTQGQFTQLLSLIRRPLQDAEVKVPATTTDNNLIQEGTNENKIDPDESWD